MALGGGGRQRPRAEEAASFPPWVAPGEMVSVTRGRVVGIGVLLTNWLDLARSFVNLSLKPQ